MYGPAKLSHDVGSAWPDSQDDPVPSNPRGCHIILVDLGASTCWERPEADGPLSERNGKERTVVSDKLAGGQQPNSRPFLQKREPVSMPSTTG
jgi:hypothetical protein